MTRLRIGMLVMVIVTAMLMIAMPVSAVITETFSLEENTLLSHQYVTGSVSYAGWYNTTNLRVNLANIGTPSTLVTYVTLGSGGYPGFASSAVTYKIGNTVVGTGDFLIGNGTFSTGGDTFIRYTFSTWDVGSYTGNVNINITYEDPLPNDLPAINQHAATPSPLYMTIANGPMGTSSFPGTYFYTNGVHAIDQVTITSDGDGSPTNIFLVDIAKTGYSTTRVLRNTTELYYTGLSGNYDESIIGIGGNVVVSMYVQGTGHFINSSVYLPYSGGGNVTPTPTPLPTLTPAPTGPNDWDNPNVLFLSVLDAMNPTSGIGGASVGIKNMTSGVWKNTTTGNGYYYWSATGASGEYILGQGETVVVSGGATGYDSQSQVVTINGKTYVKLYLTSTTQTASFGGANYVITVTGNNDGAPIVGANVYLQTGVNGQCSQQPGCYAYTGDNGVASFHNISSSATASVRVVHQAYQEQTKVLPVTLNTTNQFTFSMVRVGWVPVVTPVATTTTLVNPRVTYTAAPVLTNSAGQIITTSSGKVDYSFEMLINVIPSLMGLAIGIVEIWFLWLLVYIITGGKIIDKIMRRGRGGRR